MLKHEFEDIFDEYDSQGLGYGDEWDMYLRGYYNTYFADELTSMTMMDEPEDWQSQKPYDMGVADAKGDLLD